LNKKSLHERKYPVLMIRLARVGARKQPHYRIVVIEKDRARNGRSIEVVGTYNPRTNPATVTLKSDRVHYWTGKGAQFSETVGKLVAKHKDQPETAQPDAAQPAPAKHEPAQMETAQPATAQPEATQTEEATTA
jgi:small subunit ribosomal protein S16